MQNRKRLRTRARREALLKLQLSNAKDRLSQANKIRVLDEEDSCGGPNYVNDVQDVGDERYAGDECDLTDDDVDDWSLWGVSASKVDELLHGMKRIFPILPKTRRTLLHTPIRRNLEEMGPGLFWYKGIRKNLAQRLKPVYFEKNDNIAIDIGIDSVELFKAAKTKFVPILGCLVNDDDEPFIIAVYKGEGDPPLLDFLRRFTEEARDLSHNGFQFNGTLRNFALRFFVCDAVARQFLKQIENHNSAVGCEKCIVRGIRYRNRMVFLDIDSPLRTDEDFRLRQDEEHHKGNIEILTPLEELGINMVSQFKLDPLHLVDIGVFKRWLQFLLGKMKGIPALISNAEKAEVSRRISMLARSMPSEISRYPRTLDYFAKYAATEFRRMLMYDGLILFKNLDHDIYYNFLLLFCGIYILSDASLLETQGAVANQCLRQFIAHASQLLGAHFIVYNVHNLAHLYDECLNVGVLHSFSAYKYENYFGVMKRYLLSKHKPLAQLYNRDHERNGRLIKNLRSTAISDEDVVLSGPHNDWQEAGDQYSRLRTHKFTLSRRQQADSTFQTTGGDVVSLFCVVQYPNGGQTVVVPSIWMNKALNKTRYPPATVPNRSRLVMGLVPAKADWGEPEEVKFIHSYKTYDTADKARKLHTKGEDVNSNVDTDYSKPRRRKRNSKYESTSDDEPPKTQEKVSRKKVSEESIRAKLATLSKQAALSVTVNQKGCVPAKKVKTVTVASKKDNDARGGIENSSASGERNGGGLNYTNQVQEGSTLDGSNLDKITVCAAGGTVTSRSSSLIQSQNTEESIIINQPFNAVQSKANTSAAKEINSSRTKEPSTAYQSLVNVNQISYLQDSAASVLEASQKDKDAGGGIENFISTGEMNADGLNNIYLISEDFTLDGSNVNNIVLCDESTNNNRTDTEDMMLYGANCASSLIQSQNTDKLIVNEPSNAVQHKASKNDADKINSRKTPSALQSSDSLKQSSDFGLGHKNKKISRAHQSCTVKKKVSSSETTIEEINLRTKSMEVLLKRIVNKLFPEEAKVTKPTREISLPISSEEEFERLNNHLTDDNNFSAMVDHVVTHIRHVSDEHECAYEALELLFTTSFCRMTAWKGKRGTKVKLFGTRTLELLQCVAVKIFNDDTNLKNLNKAIQRYLIISTQKKVDTVQDEDGEESSDGDFNSDSAINSDVSSLSESDGDE
ncbi:Squalestatin S1 biosynthesis cluster protein L1 [Frankliniella fusca]|uniref:Squalestatin S1 biosynthesis cluster protein L1 n=1 Tax=Frankliniella fusca TaxID=407009 RepID=A0AAE1HCU0_9NEOP|nr:Squalestatin S1 biosynthesis cluster protein L1 [Frankliniella fusca]